MQYDFGTIDPYVDDGVTLASMLNQWRDALYSLHRGPARPAYIVPGMLWIDDSAGPTAWQVKLYDSPAIGDVLMWTLNTTTGSISIATAELLVQAAANPDVRWYAWANPVDQKVWRGLVQAAGLLRYEALNDAGAVVGSVELHRDGSIRSTTVAAADASDTLASTNWVRTFFASAGSGSSVATPTYDSFSGLLSDGTWPTVNTNVPMLITQGTQVFTRSFTAVNAAHPIEVDITLPIGAPAGVLNAGGGLFIDGASNAVAQNFNTINTSWQGPPVRIFWRGVLAAGAHTFSVRFGGQSANAWLNGFNGAPMGGGAVFASMTIREVGVGVVGPQGPAGPSGGPVAAPALATQNAGLTDTTFFAGAASDVQMASTSGTQVLSQSFTAVDATHPIEVNVQLYPGVGGVAVHVQAGLFVDGGAVAIAQGIATCNPQQFASLPILWKGVLPAGPHTFTVRWGGISGTYMLRNDGTVRLGGGNIQNSISIREVGVGPIGPQGPPGPAAGFLQTVDGKSNAWQPNKTGTYAYTTDVLPTQAAGALIYTTTITPQSATSKLKIEALVNYFEDTNAVATLALFRDGVCVRSGWGIPGNNSWPDQIVIDALLPSNAATLTTFTLYIGTNSGNTVHINGTSTTRVQGGALYSGMTITERTV